MQPNGVHSDDAGPSSSDGGGGGAPGAPPELDAFEPLPGLREAVEQLAARTRDPLAFLQQDAGVAAVARGAAKVRPGSCGARAGVGARCASGGHARPRPPPPLPSPPNTPHNPSRPRPLRAAPPTHPSRRSCTT
jgi:hypothetical protein